MEWKRGHRIAWLFAFGYFAFYAPYAALIKLVTSGHLPGVPAPANGLELLPAVIAGTVGALLLFLTLAGWWQYVHVPHPALVASGLGTGIIIATTTLAYTFHGVSIVFALLLMRGGVLILAPLVDLALRRPVRWFCWPAFALSMIAVAITLTDVDSYAMTAAVTLNLGAYLFGYVLRLPAMTRLAKIDDPVVTRRYFVGEVLVAMGVLVLFPFAVALLGGGGATEAVARGMSSVWQSSALMPALVIGVLYAGLYVFGTLVYLDRRENTFCIPLNRGASLLAGVVAAWALHVAYGFPASSLTQLVAVLPILAALTMLSPAHHIFELARAAGAKQARSGSR